MLGREWYFEVYLESPYWTETSRRFKEQRRWCETCLGTVDLELHHNGPNGDRYHDENGVSLLWREQTRPDLMQVLCVNHHREAHGLPPKVPTRGRGSASDMWIPSDDEEHDDEDSEEDIEDRTLPGLGDRPDGNYDDEEDTEDELDNIEDDEADDVDDEEDDDGFDSHDDDFDDEDEDDFDDDDSE
ncbi:MAG TPA: hypothetical protein VFW33_19615 [Gemmataceae bacterium]|nr:hypothetical protein [Gemmataceae bacterium]